MLRKAKRSKHVWRCEVLSHVVDMDKLIPKFIEKMQRKCSVQNSLKNEEESGGFTLLNFNSYHKLWQSKVCGIGEGTEEHTQVNETEYEPRNFNGGRITFPTMVMADLPHSVQSTK